MLVRIAPGEFNMGSGDDDKDADGHERPRHRVRITKPFYLGKYEATRGQFRKFIDDTGYKTEAERVQPNPQGSWLAPGIEQTDDHPVVCVTWNDAVAFCAWLSKKDGATYRLPTEAEWEYACRAGTKTRYFFGDDPAPLGDFAWCRANSGGVTHSGGQKRPNGFGLYDMLGNVWEWCSDAFDTDYYQRSPTEDPRGPDLVTPTYRVSRGYGEFFIPPQGGRPAGRRANSPNAWNRSRGFRIVREAVEPKATSASHGNAPTRVPAPKRTLRTRDITLHVPSDGRGVDPSPKEITSPASAIVLVRIEPGEFDMGSADDDKAAERDEKPRHRARIARPFYIGKYEVTHGQFRKFVEQTNYGAREGWNNPNLHQEDDHPVIGIDWNDAIAFCEWLSRKDGATYRLPTEAEWEYACRAGTATLYSFGDDPAQLGDYAWFKGNSGGRLHPVGQKRPNAFALYDMHGNAREMCADPWTVDYKAEPKESAAIRAVRGGCWYDGPAGCRSANRDDTQKERGSPWTSFRVVRVVNDARRP